MLHNFDTNKANTFNNRMLGMLNDGALCLMISLGHRVGLFDTMAKLPPSTSEEIAKTSGLVERYVREWLAAMATGRIIELDRNTNQYWLPPEHAEYLTRSSSPNNIAVSAQYIPQLAAVYDEITECFRNGGGVPYEKFPRVHAVMAEDSDQLVLSSLDTCILPLIPGLAEQLKRGIDVLDLGCGSGRAMNRLASCYHLSRFTGYDLSAEAIDQARSEAASLGLSNVYFEVKDLSRFDVDAPCQLFDLVTTFDAVHDQGNPSTLLKGIANALRRDGVYLMQEIHAHSSVADNMENPLAPFLYTGSCFHCMPVSLAQGGEGLGAMWGQETATQLLREAGFTRIEIRQLPNDIQSDYYIVRL